MWGSTSSGDGVGPASPSETGRDSTTGAFSGGGSDRDYFGTSWVNPDTQAVWGSPEDLAMRESNIGFNGQIIDPNMINPDTGLTLGSPEDLASMDHCIIPTKTFYEEFLSVVSFRYIWSKDRYGGIKVGTNEFLVTEKVKTMLH